MATSFTKLYLTNRAAPYTPATIRGAWDDTAGAVVKALDANTAYEILSLDIADVDVGENVGAKLQAEQAEANKLIAQAHAEIRRAAAVADKTASLIITGNGDVLEPEEGVVAIGSGGLYAQCKSLVSLNCLAAA